MRSRPFAQNDGLCHSERCRERLTCRSARDIIYFSNFLNAFITAAIIIEYNGIIKKLVNTRAGNHAMIPFPYKNVKK